jgi:hypothetical protein
MHLLQIVNRHAGRLSRPAQPAALKVGYAHSLALRRFSML